MGTPGIGTFTIGDYVVTTAAGGTKTGAYLIMATASRNILTADVLDYDGLKGNYALIWKKITITHDQSTNISASGTLTCAPRAHPMGCADQPVPYVPVSETITSCSRVVDFYLTYSVNGDRFDKLICTATENRNYGIHSYGGERVWGVSIQAADNFIAYHFAKEVPSGVELVGFGDGYDSCYGLESWTVDRDERDLWKLKSNIVGIINVNDGLKSADGYLYEKEYLAGDGFSSGDVYSIGIANVAT